MNGGVRGQVRSGQDREEEEEMQVVKVQVFKEEKYMRISRWGRRGNRVGGAG